MASKLPTLLSLRSLHSKLPQLHAHAVRASHAINVAQLSSCTRPHLHHASNARQTSYMNTITRLKVSLLAKRFQSNGMPDAPPDIAAELTRWERFKAAVVAGRPYNEQVRNRVLNTLELFLCAAFMGAFFWQRVMDGADPVAISEAVKAMPQHTPHAAELSDFNLGRAFEVLDVNKMGEVTVPQWWKYAISFLGVQLHPYTGLLSQFLSGDLLQLGFTMVLVQDMLRMMARLNTPTLPGFYLMYLMLELATDAPSFYSFPYINNDAAFMEMQDRVLQQRGEDQQWLDLYAELYPGLDENDEEMTWEDYKRELEAMPSYIWHDISMQPYRDSLAHNASKNAFWTLTFLEAKLSHQDILALIQPIVGFMPVLSAMYTFTLMEALFVARSNIRPMVIRTTGMAALGVISYLFPDFFLGQRGKMDVQMPATGTEPAESGYIPIRGFEGLSILSNLFGGFTAWLLSVGPFRAMTYWAIRRSARKAQAAAFVPAPLQ